MVFSVVNWVRPVAASPTTGWLNVYVAVPPGWPKNVAPKVLSAVFVGTRLPPGSTLKLNNVSAANGLGFHSVPWVGVGV